MAILDTNSLRNQPPNIDAHDLLLDKRDEVLELLTYHDILYKEFGTYHILLETKEEEEYLFWRLIFGEYLELGYHIDISFTTDILELPKSLWRTNFSIYACQSNLESLNNLEHSYSLDLGYSKITSLGNLKSINGYLGLRGLTIEIPKDLKVMSEIYLERSRRKVKIPKHLKSKVEYL